MGLINLDLDSRLSRGLSISDKVGARLRLDIDLDLDLAINVQGSISDLDRKYNRTLER